MAPSDAWNDQDSRKAPGPTLPTWIPWLFLLVGAFMLARMWNQPRVVVDPQGGVARGPRLVLPPQRKLPRVDVLRPGEEAGRQGLVRPASTKSSDPNAGLRDVTPAKELDDDEQETIELFRRWTKSVVFIQTSALARNRFTMDVSEIPQGAGSGFVWDTAGHIVTNYHVVQAVHQEGIKASVTFSNQERFPAELVGIDPSKDLAVLKVNAPSGELQPVQIGTSRDLQVGQNVLAIGNPFGFDHTLTTGVVSGLGREIRATNRRRIDDVIQTDAAINPGNSGGPLLDSSGRVIGVNTAIFSPSGAYAGIGFAIPVDTVARTIPQLVQFGEVVHPRLGIEPFPEPIVREAGIRGVLVRNVADGSPAESAGILPTTSTQTEIRLGDVIVGINDKKVESLEDLLDELDRLKFGDRVEVHLIRGLATEASQELTVSVVLTELNPSNN